MSPSDPRALIIAAAVACLWLVRPSRKDTTMVADDPLYRGLNRPRPPAGLHDGETSVNEARTALGLPHLDAPMPHVRPPAPPHPFESTGQIRARVNRPPAASTLERAAAELAESRTWTEGDRVRKVGGDYSFEGVVVGVVRKLSGVRRYVVEDMRGVLFIFNGGQLERRA